MFVSFNTVHFKSDLKSSICQFRHSFQSQDWLLIKTWMFEIYVWKYDWVTELPVYRFHDTSLQFYIHPECSKKMEWAYCEEDLANRLRYVYHSISTARNINKYNVGLIFTKLLKKTLYSKLEFWGFPCRFRNVSDKNFYFMKMGKTGMWMLSCNVENSQFKKSIISYIVVNIIG